MEKIKKLKYIFSKISKSYPQKRLVFNDGSPNSKIMIIGEAPGKDEEKQGLPFIGRAGKLLMASLESLGWKRDDFYISNIVKYRPTDAKGGNRTPTEDEINKFRFVIEKEINIVEPKLIVLVGRIAMSSMGFIGSMSENRGRVIEKDGNKFLITYHPAAILRNPNWTPLFRKDLSKIKNIISS